MRLIIAMVTIAMFVTFSSFAQTKTKAVKKSATSTKSTKNVSLPTTYSIELHKLNDFDSLKNLYPWLESADERQSYTKFANYNLGTKKFFIFYQEGECGILGCTLKIFVLDSIKNIHSKALDVTFNAETDIAMLSKVKSEYFVFFYGAQDQASWKMIKDEFIKQ
ncbi:hypothetical protein [Ferruginibacter albus]|uniref:hypothetical protein n=1 Tax=Ferruginibacter albus TaxID=2875540 RepID=UPI001CC40B3E|nr:hypothetical protein [Ferruginibacter albus]UAY53178.1 hypothetical protein K9M53_05780 [Ferruginibacter albus]